MKKWIALSLMLLLNDLHADRAVLMYCSANYFPTGNVDRVIVVTNASGIALYERGSPTDIASGYFLYERVDGKTSFDRLSQVSLDDDAIQRAGTFRSLLRLHFGDGAETNTTVTESAVSAYFIQRRLDGTSDPTDAADALILQSLFERMKAMTIDGTTWSFPWGALP